MKSGMSWDTACPDGQLDSYQVRQLWAVVPPQWAGGPRGLTLLQEAITQDAGQVALLTCPGVLQPRKP